MPQRPHRFIPPLGPPKRNAQQRVLAQWRRVTPDSLSPCATRPPQSAGTLMAALLKNLRWDRRRTEAEILRAWNQLMDPAVTAHAQPTGLARGTLFVSVDSSVWLDEIVRYRRKEILDRLQHSFGRNQIQRLSFRVG